MGPPAPRGPGLAAGFLRVPARWVSARGFPRWEGPAGGRMGWRRIAGRVRERDRSRAVGESSGGGRHDHGFLAFGDSLTGVRS